MKVWIVTEEIITTIDEWTPQDLWTSMEKIFDSKDKAITYVRECIKNAIDEQMSEPDPDVEDIIDHVPTDEEVLEKGGIWYKTVNEFGKGEHSYSIDEYDVE